ncbi:NAD(P)H-dependent oxidoreductase [Bacillus sp. H-16]|uniref:NAD(P)H-dependent oxidoreductase n=1 Tax=Alteribacter salitolerans TaxID=2912333 RepID=UPI001964C670|nr:NAD(P)H-dependent oxidoreductase [Alteribacter salitolerans]
MNHLLVYMHPSKDSFNGSLLKAYAGTLKNQGHQVEVRSLYEMDFQPLLSREEYKDSFKGVYKEDVKTEHRYFLWADAITFLFPLWWGSFPAAGKGYLDRVLSYGVAYGLDGEKPIPLLTGKKAAIICTTGAPSEEYAASGMHQTMNRLFDEAIFRFCGLEPAFHEYFGGVLICKDHEREKMIERVKELAGSWMHGS